MKVTSEPHCIDIVAPLIDEFERQGYLDSVQLMGGIGSAALQHPDTVILPEERRIVTSVDFTDNNPNLARHRIVNGEPTTLRDVDILVLSADQEFISDIKHVTEQIVDGQLEVSVFGLRGGEHLREQEERPFGLKSLKTFVSDRYVMNAGIVKALTPFSVPLSETCLEGWTLEVGGNEFPVTNPAATILNYLTRSISGLRPKDYEKVQKMTSLVSSLWPDMADWIMDGPGQSQIELASIFQTLRHANSRSLAARALRVGGVIELKAGRIQDLRENDAFLFKTADSVLQEAMLALAVIKSRGLGIPESNPTIVRLYQQFIEAKMGTITQNK